MVDNIELVKNMKHTEIGILPKDWNIKKIEEVADIETGNKNTQDKDNNGKYDFYVRSQQVEKINTYSFDGEAVLTAGDGVGVGKVFHYVNGKFDFHQRVYKISNFRGINAKFFYYYFKNNFLKQVSKYTAKSSVDSVRLEMISKMNIPIPSIEEQEMIAKSLSDIDDLILELEKLINKKKLIKEGTVKSLLTGEIRLNKNNEKWEKHKISNIFEITAGGDLDKNTFSSYKTNINKFEIYSNTVTNKGVYGFTSKPRYNKNTITVTARGTIGYAIARSEEYDAIGRIIVLTPKAKIDCNFVAEYINNMVKFSIESTGVPQLTVPQISKYEIMLPKYEEQKTISNILIDMDNEIEKLNVKLEKYNSIKKGMMEELLTGKRRLV